MWHQEEKKSVSRQDFLNEKKIENFEIDMVKYINHHRSACVKAFEKVDELLQNEEHKMNQRALEEAMETTFWMYSEYEDRAIEGNAAPVNNNPIIEELDSNVEDQIPNIPEYDVSFDSRNKKKFKITIYLSLEQNADLLAKLCGC
ncbi:hypothetical protein RFI_28367 [Reticulomyxa filosa]|uniref:Uncharacterized protein n=1 Tax=Reticulomyxa filosa TaxID=46433 RepID=X6M6D4_RETFI|nr:hypothetical protein RFI_28367 [Reticulomyxa filosa]|eukprot:ETO09022.1 hypothetical protein RFI_28367 [Reticulomyxa filosa]